MTRRIKVGFLDSGVGPEVAERVVAARSFTGDALAPDRLNHGSRIAAIILHHAPDADLVNAQVFGESMTTSPERVAAGLDWLVEQAVDLVNLSFGLQQDREILRNAVNAALDGGIHMIAAMPARGARVYPAGYPGVTGATGDARCGPGQISHLGGQPADFGASPCDLAGTSGGASFAAAHLSGLSARLLAEHTELSSALIRHATYIGRERR